MAKLTEKQLYATWLDVGYADEVNQELIDQLSDQLKEARAMKRKSIKLLKKASDHYKTVTGKEPKRLK